MQRRWVIAGTSGVIAALGALAALTAGPSAPPLDEDTTRLVGKRLLDAAHPGATLSDARSRVLEEGPPDGVAVEIEVAYALPDGGEEGLIAFGLAVLSTDPCRVRPSVLRDSGPAPARAPAKPDALQPTYKALCAAMD